MTLGDKISVERLDADRLERIESNVLVAYRAGARAETPSRRVLVTAARWLVPAVAVCGVAMAIYLNLRAQTTAPARALAIAEAPALTTIETGGEASRLELGDAVVMVAAKTRVEMQRSSGGAITITLAFGRVDCEVEPRSGRAPFVVRAGGVDVTVVGTVFTVERDDEVRVVVSRGRVRVDGPGASASLAAGQEWSGPATMIAAVDGATIGGDETPVAELSVAVDEPVVELEPRRRTRRVPVVAVLEPAPAAPVDSVDSVGAERESILSARPSRDLASVAGGDAGLAAIMELEGADPSAAVLEYQKLASSGRGDSARFALYSKAHLQYFRLGDRRGAIRTAKAFERRFSSGAYLEDVLWLRIRATCGKSVDKACRAAAYTYASKFPSGRWTDRAQQIVNWDVTE